VILSFNVLIGDNQFSHYHLSKRLSIVQTVFLVLLQKSDGCRYISLLVECLVYIKLMLFCLDEYSFVAYSEFGQFNTSFFSLFTMLLVIGMP
jgi:hypothetical protein